MIRVKEFLRRSIRRGGSRVRLIGPNCPGIITPGQCKIGIMPGHIHTPGRSASSRGRGTLTYEAVYQLTQLALGQSTCVGHRRRSGQRHEFHRLSRGVSERSGATEAVILIGEIGGMAEEEAACWIAGNLTDKPVVAFIAGQTAPPGRRMGHAGAIISGGQGTAADKMKALTEAGITVVKSPADLGSAMKKKLAG